MNAAEQAIRAEIAQRGAISWARFMELALYHPEGGYYARPRPIGRTGDFFTSVSVGPVFGELLACQFAAWIKSRLPPSAPFQLIEAGPHDGQLALDILTAFRTSHPELLSRLQYVLLEASPTRRDAQSRKLDVFADSVCWIGSWQEIPRRSVQGIIFSNEFLDALPVHRLVWDATRQCWWEYGVQLASDRFVWTRIGDPQSAEQLLGDACIEVPAELRAVLPDAFTLDVSPQAVEWWREAARRLHTGWLLTFDYGLTYEELLRPERHQGTLRAYRGHRQADDPLADPGEQDLTASIHFTSLQQAGEAEGLTTQEFCTQERFLSRVFTLHASESLGPATNRRSPSPEWIRQFRTLVHPGHLGQVFRCLVQSCGVE